MAPQDSQTGFHGRFLLWFSILFLFIFSVSLPDYGITWDSAAAEFYVGDKYLAFYKTLDPNFLDLAQKNIGVYRDREHPDFSMYTEYLLRRPHHVWSVGPMLSSLSKELFFTSLRLMDPIDAHHAFLGVLFLLLVYALYLFMNKHFGRWQAVIAPIALVLMPRLWADLHNNIKDVPAAIFLSLTLLLLYEAAARPSARIFIAAALLWGISLATKANALFVPVSIAAPVICLGLDRWKRGESIAPWRLGKLLIVGLLLAGLSFAFSWPYMLYHFPDGIVDYAKYLTKAAASGEPGVQTLALKEVLYTTPLTILVSACAGLGVCLYRIALDPQRRAVSLFVLSALFVPIARVSLPGAFHFDGIRHFEEFLVPLSMLSAIGIVEAVRWPGEKLYSWESSTTASTVLPLCGIFILFSPIMYWNYANHPFQICYFNKLIGGLRGAQKGRFPSATDYWGSSYRKAIEWLNKNTEYNTILVTGVGEHIIGLMAKTWLRPDIKPVPLESLDKILAGAAQPVYLLYITRIEAYSKRLAEIDKKAKPVMEFKVDGGVLLKIVRMGAAPAKGSG